MVKISKNMKQAAKIFLVKPSQTSVWSLTSGLQHETILIKQIV